MNESGERVQNAIAVKVLLPWSTVTGICICPSSSPLMHLSSLVNVKWSKLQRREKRKKSLPSFPNQSGLVTEKIRQGCFYGMHLPVGHQTIEINRDWTAAKIVWTDILCALLGSLLPMNQMMRFLPREK